MRRYGRGWRCVEIVSLVTAGILATALVARIGTTAGRGAWVLLPAFFVGMMAADFFSGMAHWFADTWGRPDWPVIGKSLIRSFREHHVDPLDITHHDVVEANGNNALVTVPVLAATLFVPLTASGGVFASGVLLVMCAALILTNQIHLWAHLERPPRSVAWLQRLWILLPRDEHAVHHRPPFVAHYCITTGWLNGLLGWIRFFRAMERVISAVTGAVAREDDLRRTGLTPPSTAPRTS